MSDEGAKRRRILVVEDDDDVRASLVDLLTSSGYETHAARDGWQALQVLKEDRRFCAILLDLYMPVMDGWQFREEQKRDAQLARIPVVAVSARGFHAPAIDADAFLSKPMHISELREAVAWLCDRSGESG